MIRVTTNSTLHMYQSNLMQSSNQLYSAMEKLMTGRPGPPAPLSFTVR